MRDNVLVIPSRADGEGPRYRNKNSHKKRFRDQRSAGLE
jgi:hypothetical protein